MTDSRKSWGRNACRKFALVAAMAAVFFTGMAARAQSAGAPSASGTQEAKPAAPPTTLLALAPAKQEKTGATEDRRFFPKDWLRGYADFAIAPPHNEPDLGRCNSQGPPCSAFARYVLSAYVEVQPFGRGPLKHLYGFVEPRAWFGKTIPQTLYTWSWQPLALERVIGLGFELPKNFELRLTNHAVSSFGPFDDSLGPTDAGPGSPLGLYTTASVRWYFGGYGGRTPSW